MTGEYFTVLQRKHEGHPEPAVMKAPGRDLVMDYCKITFHGNHRTGRIGDVLQQLGDGMTKVVSIKPGTDEAICRRDGNGECAVLKVNQSGEVTTGLACLGR